MNERKAFTLIELSVVLVIVGFIISGVVAGTEIINQSRMRRLINDVTQVQTAINTFREKFGFLPGDFSFRWANLDKCYMCKCRCSYWM
ncbi:MAG: type II secretion system protein [Alphaproteobacteria bacterium]